MAVYSSSVMVARGRTVRVKNMAFAGKRALRGCQRRKGENFKAKEEESLRSCGARGDSEERMEIVGTKARESESRHEIYPLLGI